MMMGGFSAPNALPIISSCDGSWLWPKINADNKLTNAKPRNRRNILFMVWVFAIPAKSFDVSIYHSPWVLAQQSPMSISETGPPHLSLGQQNNAPLNGDGFRADDLRLVPISWCDCPVDTGAELPQQGFS
jgi:hypothetical protein